MSRASNELATARMTCLKKRRSAPFQKVNLRLTPVRCLAHGGFVFQDGRVHELRIGIGDEKPTLDLGLLTKFLFDWGGLRSKKWLIAAAFQMKIMRCQPMQMSTLCVRD